MKKKNLSKEQLLLENKELQSRLTETEDVLNAIRSGEADAIVVSGTKGEKVFSLTSAETPYRVFIEKMSEGAVTLASDGVILYCNQRFSELINEPMEKVIGSSFQRFIQESEKQTFNSLLQSGVKEKVNKNITFQISDNETVKTFSLLLSPSPIKALGDVCVIVTDISKFLHIENELRKVQDTLESRVAKRTESLNKKIDELASSRIAALNMMEDIVESKNNLELSNIKLTTEITERKKAEEELHTSRDLLSSVLENIPIRVFWKDTDLRYLGCNTLFALDAGMSHPEDLIGKDDSQMGWSEEAELYRADDKRVIDSNTPKLGYEERQTTPDGHTIWLRTSKVPLLDAQGKVIGLLGIYDDITERKNAEKEHERLQNQLQQAQKMESVGRLAGGVAHDYNNISSVILGYSELALDQVEKSDPLYGDLMEIFTAAERSADITRQLLTFARKQTVAPEVLDLNDSIGDLLKMLRRLIGEDIDLAWLPGAEIRPIKIDPSQINQIMANLCVNARDAIADVGRITVETKNINLDENYCDDYEWAVPGEYIELSVSDEGCGMTPETRDNIFEPFFTTKGTEGTGLGLATVYGIVKQNNGFINVYSEMEKGTTFKIYLPIHVGQTVKEHSEKNIELPLSRGETVLLVDDDDSILQIGKRILEKLGYAVLFSSSPMEAISLAAEHADEINLLITDVVMPKMNGRELSERLQSLYPNLKTLFMSGYTADIIAKRGILESGVNFIEKPFSNKDLAFKIREVMGERTSKNNYE